MTFQGLVLAGGEGSRMLEDGVPVSKALVPVAGRPQALRVLEALQAIGCATLTCAAREDVPGLLPALATWQLETPLHVVPCRTPSSLHTLVQGLAAVPPGPVFCSMVDTVMQPGDWLEVARRAAIDLQEGAGGVIAVTSFVHDKSALYVRRDADGDAVGFGLPPVPDAVPCVTGGVYAFGPAVRPLAAEALRAGVERMRGFLDWLVRRVRVTTVEVPRIIDLDRAADLRLANAWLAPPEP